MSTTRDDALVGDLAAQISGSVLGPQDARYDAARAVHNGLIDDHDRCRRFSGWIELAAAIEDWRTSAGRAGLPVARDRATEPRDPGHRAARQAPRRLTLTG